MVVARGARDAWNPEKTNAAAAAPVTVMISRTQSLLVPGAHDRVWHRRTALNAMRLVSAARRVAATRRRFALGSHRIVSRGAAACGSALVHVPTLRQECIETEQHVDKTAAESGGEHSVQGEPVVSFN